jgi:hypothetical protein
MNRHQTSFQIHLAPLNPGGRQRAHPLPERRLLPRVLREAPAHVVHPRHPPHAAR